MDGEGEQPEGGRIRRHGNKIGQTKRRYTSDPYATRAGNQAISPEVAQTGETA
jgi:hypothetical protein